MAPTAPQTTQRLKGEINQGKTGDKTREGFDPGLATLGTDDEAAGSPNRPEQVAMARSHELPNAPAVPPEQGAHISRPGLPAMWLVLGAFAAVVAIALSVWLTRG